MIETTPESIRFHLIQDSELEALANMSPPTAFGFSMTCFGAFLGLSPESLRAIGRAFESNLIFTLYDVIILTLWVTCLVSFLITMIYSGSGGTQVNKTLEAIRQRPSRNMEDKGYGRFENLQKEV